jgi:small subunit ribosomal protein S2
MEVKEAKINNASIESLFKVGAHFAYSKSRRHPSTKPYIFGIKNKVEIFNLEKTSEMLDSAKEFVKNIAKTGGQVLFVGGKSEAKEAVKDAAVSVNMPFVSGRWIGGTLTNFPNIKKRVEKLEDLTSKKEKGELGKYTKKERLLIDREIERLNFFFSGLIPMKDLPKAVFIVDSGREEIAVAEAKEMKIPVVSLSGSDCNLKGIDYPIPANDSSAASIKFFVNEIASAYRAGKNSKA